MIEQIVHPFIPVNSFVSEPAVIVETPKPEIGIRWGGPSQFTHSNESKKSSRRFKVDVGDDNETDELEEEVEIVKLQGEAFKFTTKDRQGAFIQMTNVLHFTGHRVVERYDDRGRRQLSGLLEIDYYFELVFNEP